MWKNRTGYGIMTLAAVVLFWLSGQIFLIYLALGLAVLALLMGILIRRDASRIHVEMSVPGRVLEGTEIELILKVQVRGRIWATQKMLINIGMKNRMFGTADMEQAELVFERNKKEYQVRIPMRCCGQIDFRIEDIQIEDPLRLFHIRMENPSRLHCICYPRRMNLRVETSRKTIGTPKNEGAIQNRKGNDPSEMFDIREYVPGDDIRSIHWKLSSKTDTLILREPSNPSHYRVALMADYGIEEWDTLDRETKEKEWNTVIAAGAAICKGLIDKGEKFCMIFPGVDGLQIFEIENRQDYAQMLAQWMRMPMKKEQGTGYRYFMKQGLDHEFSRLLILATGKYEQKLEGIENRIGITVVSASEQIEAVRMSRITETCDMVELPIVNTDGIYRIMC